MPGATDEILVALERYGFEWDGPITYQSDSRAAHEAAVKTLLDTRQAYRCGCSRRDLAAAGRGPLGIIYPGTCRGGTEAAEYAWRVRTNNEPLIFTDSLQGRQAQQLESESGDFIVLRRDGLIAYQLAVVVDDHLQGITEIVRGIDLLDSTPRQIHLQQLLDYPTPVYAHIPVAVNPDGQKLSKNTGAAGIPSDKVRRTLVSALQALGQQPPADLQAAPLADIWTWASEHWRIDVLKGETRILPTRSAVAGSENGLS